MKLSNGVKSVDLKNGEFLYFWYANNAGRGDNNVTIIRSSSNVRARISSLQNNVIAKIQTSGWAGNVNFSKNVQLNLGLHGI